MPIYAPKTFRVSVSTPLASVMSVGGSMGVVLGGQETERHVRVTYYMFRYEAGQYQTLGEIIS